MVGLQQLRYSRRIGRPARNTSRLRISMTMQRKTVGSSKKRRIKVSPTTKSDSNCCMKSAADIKSISVKHNQLWLNKECTKSDSLCESSSLKRCINNSTPSKCKKMGCAVPRRHVKSLHSHHKQELFHCHICDSTFLYIRSLRRHLKRTHHCESIERQTIVNHTSSIKNVVNEITVRNDKIVWNENNGSSESSNNERITHRVKIVKTIMKHKSVHTKLIESPGGSEVKTGMNAQQIVSRKENFRTSSRASIGTLMQVAVSECGKGFLKRDNLKIHTNRHIDATPYIRNKEGSDAAFATAASRFHHNKLHSKTIGLPTSKGDLKSNDDIDVASCNAHSSKSEEILTKKKVVQIENISTVSKTLKQAALTNNNHTPCDVESHTHCSESTANIKNVSVKLNTSSLIESQQTPKNQHTVSCVERHNVFKSHCTLKVHMNRHNATNQPFDCWEVGCTAAFENLSSSQSDHTDAYGKSFCPKCGKVFSNLHEWREHADISTDTTPFECSGNKTEPRKMNQGNKRAKEMSHKIQCGNLRSDVTSPKAGNGLAHCDENCGSSSFEAKSLLISEEAAYNEDIQSLEESTVENTKTSVANLSVGKLKHALIQQNLCCKICKKLFVSKTSLKSHMNHHARSKRFKCKEVGCIASYGRLSSLYYHHAAIHDKLYHCQRCDGPHWSKRDLMKHNTVCHGENVQFPSVSSNEDKEMAANKKIAPPSRIHCSPLNAQKVKALRKGSTTSSHSSRSQTHHGDKKILSGKNSLRCTKCGKVFKSWQFLRIHLNHHNSNNPYKCKEVGCIASYKYASNLKRHHTSVHKKIKKLYSCQECDKSFSDQRHLKKHVVSHVQAASLTCKTKACETGLVNPSPIVHHEKIHNGSHSSIIDVSNSNGNLDASLNGEEGHCVENSGLLLSGENSSERKRRVMYRKKVIQPTNVRCRSKTNTAVNENNEKPCYSNNFGFSPSIKKEIDVSDEVTVHFENFNFSSNVDNLSLTTESVMNNVTDVLSKTGEIASFAKKKTTVEKDTTLHTGSGLLSMDNMTFVDYNKSFHSENSEVLIHSDFSGDKKASKKGKRSVLCATVKFPSSAKMETCGKHKKAVCNEIDSVNKAVQIVESPEVSNTHASKDSVTNRTKSVGCVGCASRGSSISVFNHQIVKRAKRRLISSNKEMVQSDDGGSPLGTEKRIAFSAKKRIQSVTVLSCSTVLDSDNETASGPSSFKKRVVVDHQKEVASRIVESPVNTGSSSLLGQRSTEYHSQETSIGFSKMNKAYSSFPSIPKVTHRHITLKPYKCQESDCGATFASVANLWNHKISVHDRTTPFKVLVNATT